MSMRPVTLLLAAVAGLAACSLPVPGLPTIAEAPLPPVTAFPDPPEPSAAPKPAGSGVSTGSGGVSKPGSQSGLPATPEPDHDTGPFQEGAFKDVGTPTKFAPVFSYAFDPLKAGAAPGLSTDVYQTANELEIREIHLIVEKAGFAFDKLAVGKVVGDGQMDLGTPPKATLPVTLKVEETDQKTYALISSKASGTVSGFPLTLYLADIRVKLSKGNLLMTTIGNLARGNDKNGVRTTERSARIVQRLQGGYIVFPATSSIAARTIMYTEEDPVDGQVAIRTTLQTHQLAP